MAWEAVADTDQLEEGDMMVVQLGGEPICVVRLSEEEAVACHNTCTHQQQPLNEGYLQDDDTGFVSCTPAGVMELLSRSGVDLKGKHVVVLGQATADVGNDVMLGIAAILASALCYAVNIVLMRRQALAAKPLEINFFQSLTVMVTWLLVLPFLGLPAAPEGQWAWVVLASLLSTCGTLLYGWGYARGPASYLAVTEYSGFLWASLFGWLAFHERVSTYTLAGATLIVGGCIIAARGKRPDPPEIDVAA